MSKFKVHELHQRYIKTHEVAAVWMRIILSTLKQYLAVHPQDASYKLPLGIFLFLTFLTQTVHVVPARGMEAFAWHCVSV